MSILLVDNEQYQIEALKRYLVSQGYQILEANNGKEAVEQLEQRPQDIELIITDYLMPDVDGMSLLQEIRSRDPLLPVIFMTAYADKDVVIQALRYSCDGFLEKPFTPEQLLREIKRIQDKACQRVGERLNHQRQLLAEFMDLGGSEDQLLNNLGPTPDQLLQIQKMGLVGSMTSGIAHDFNNLLQTIQGHIELLLLDKGQKQPGYEELRKVEYAAERGAELVKQLLAFSRQNHIDFQPLDLNQVIVQVDQVLSRTIPQMIEIKMNLAPDLKPIRAMQVQIEQLLINLILNARDAMPKGGELTLTTKNVVLGAEKDLRAGHQPGTYVQITVTDTGCGMPEDIIAKIFQPFFTTKSKGTGLGLFMVKVIVHRHHGLLSCSSTLGSGTTFTIEFPVLQGKIVFPGLPGRALAAPKSVKGVVLLVEDELTLRQLGQERLSRAGYTVLAAGNGEEALEIFRRRQQDIDVILLDLLMPGMGGEECLKELLKISPQAKIILMSGCDLSTLNEVMAAGARKTLSKPYKMEELLRVVEQVMAPEPGGNGSNPRLHH